MSLLGSCLGDRSHLHQACWVILGATDQYPGQRRPLCSGRAAPFPTWIQGPGSEAGPPPVAFPTAFPRNLVFVSLRVNRHRKRPPGCLSPPPAGPTHPVYKFSACLALLCKHSACLPLAVDSPLNLSSLPAPPLSAQPCVRVTPACEYPATGTCPSQAWRFLTSSPIFMAKALTLEWPCWAGAPACVPTYCPFNLLCPSSKRRRGHEKA